MLTAPAEPTGPAGAPAAAAPCGAVTAANTSTDRTETSAWRVLRRSDDRRSRPSSLANAKSRAAYLSSAAASARIAGPRDLIVSSTRSLRSDCRGLRSFDTSTSMRIAF